MIYKTVAFTVPLTDAMICIENKPRGSNKGNRYLEWFQGFGRQRKDGVLNQSNKEVGGI